MNWLLNVTLSSTYWDQVLILAYSLAFVMQVLGTMKISFIKVRTFWGISELEVLTVNSDHREQKTISK